MASSVTIQPSNKNGWIGEYLPTTNHKSDASEIVQAYSPYKAHAIQEFDFSASVPDGATITVATLSLYANTVTSGRTIGCYRLRRADWSEEYVTWNQYKSGSNWGTAGALNTATDHDTTDGVTSESLSSAGWQNWTVTAQVQYARNNVAGVARFLLRDTGGSANAAQLYYSRVYSDTSKCPKLYIEYTVPGPALLKTVNGLAVASVKTLRSSVVIASGKTWDGVA